MFVLRPENNEHEKVYSCGEMPEFFFVFNRLQYGQNFEKSSSGKIHYHSSEEHPKISKIAKFGREML